MKTSKEIIALILALGSLLAVQPATAQFAGDVFFVEPSISVPQDGEATIELAAFVGGSVFGAAQVDLIYDPNELTILSVSPGAMPQIQDGFSYRQEEGVLSLIALNGASLDKPIGTISLAKIAVSPKAPAGAVIRINTAVKSVLRQDSSAYGSPNGFAMDIAVTSPLATLSQFADQPSNDINQQDLYDRALTVRPEGSIVEIMALDANNKASPVVVRTGNPEASQD